MAAQSDRHVLYQDAVQDPEAEIDFVEETWAQLRDRPAELLREDFCGTANTACEWVRRQPFHYAIGVDLDGHVGQFESVDLEFGDRHAELLPLPAIRQGHIETSLGPAQPHGGNRQTAAVQGFHHLFESTQSEALLNATPAETLFQFFHFIWPGAASFLFRHCNADCKR